VSNDKQLRAACNGDGVAVLWGFEVLALLVANRALSVPDAEELAEQIAKSNPRIGKVVLSRFLSKIGARG
jgi:hypothetical protein